MTAHPALAAVAAAALLMGCSAPGSQTSASSHPATAASQPGSIAATSQTSGATASTKQSDTATSSAPKATTAASAPWTLSINGLGALKLGTLYSTLRQQGYVTAATDDCPGSSTSQALQDQGVYLYPSGQGDTAVLAEVSVTKGTYATVSGARVGMTISQIKQMYGTQFTTETKIGNGGSFTVGVVHIGSREIIFEFPFGADGVDPNPVQAMVARPWSPDMKGECEPPHP